MADDKELTEGEQELLDIATKCVKIARKAWWSNFTKAHSNGDQNRTSIGKIANTLLEHQLAQRLPVKV